MLRSSEIYAKIEKTKNPAFRKWRTGFLSSFICVSLYQAWLLLGRHPNTQTEHIVNLADGFQTEVLVPFENARYILLCTAQACGEVGLRHTKCFKSVKHHKGYAPRCSPPRFVFPSFFRLLAPATGCGGRELLQFLYNFLVHSGWFYVILAGLQGRSLHRKPAAPSRRLSLFPIFAAHGVYVPFRPYGR